MPNLVTLTIEVKFKEFAEGLALISTEAKDIEKAYFASDASTLVGALATGTTAASLDTKLTKTQYQNGITFIQQLGDFFGNVAVSQADYLTTIEQVIYGNASSPAIVSDAAENLANRLKTLFDSCLDHFKKSEEILAIYDNSELSVLVACI